MVETKLSPDANEFLVFTLFGHDTLIPGRQSDFEQSTGLNLCFGAQVLGKMKSAISHPLFFFILTRTTPTHNNLNPSQLQRSRSSALKISSSHLL